jgi:hypothetical protein
LILLGSPWPTQDHHVPGVARARPSPINRTKEKAITPAADAAGNTRHASIGMLLSKKKVELPKIAVSKPHPRDAD